MAFQPRRAVSPGMQTQKEAAPHLTDKDYRTLAKAKRANRLVFENGGAPRDAQHRSDELSRQLRAAMARPRLVA
jgi:hypothetical protein